MSPASDSHIITGSHTLKCTPPRALSTTGCLIHNTHNEIKDHHFVMIPSHKRALAGNICMTHQKYKYHPHVVHRS
jgi:hypothetical protein